MQIYSNNFNNWNKLLTATIQTWFMTILYNKKK